PPSASLLAGCARRHTGGAGVAILGRQLPPTDRRDRQAIQLEFHWSRWMRTGTAVPIPRSRKNCAAWAHPRLERTRARDSDADGRRLVLGGAERPEPAVGGMVPAEHGTAPVHDLDRRRTQDRSDPKRAETGNRESGLQHAIHGDRRRNAVM